jgi:hypothetical protein
MSGLKSCTNRCLRAGFVETVSQHVFGMRRVPAIGKHLFEPGIVGVRETWKNRKVLD